MDLHQIQMEDMFDPSWKSLNVKVKGRGHQRQISSPLKISVVTVSETDTET